MSSFRDRINDAWMWAPSDDDESNSEYIEWDFLNENPSWNGEYIASFPNEWRSSHLEGTGPENCNNCATYGTWCGKFIGYCANCAVYDYEGERGRGFIDNGVEFIDETSIGYKSVFDTYLFDVNLENEDLTFESENTGSPMDVSGDEVQDAQMQEEFYVDPQELTDEDVYGCEGDGEDPGWNTCHYEGGYDDN